MSEEALDEMSVLSAIFCEKDEFELIEESAQTGLVYRIRTAIDTDSKTKTLDLTFHLPPLYPQTTPDISVTSSHFSRNHCQELKRAMLSKASTLPHEPMVHHLVTWLQHNFTDLVTTPNSRGDCSSTADSNAEHTWMALLHLDHMRSKAKYIKLIEKWTSELGLTGRLFVGRPILILLQGTKESIKLSKIYNWMPTLNPSLKEYIHLQRTVKVDVDSSGKRCKEKMMRVLCEVPLTEDFKRISTFEVKEDLSLEDLRREFDLVGSMKLYQEFVTSLQ
ncbi:RWD domain-containing protein 3 isoform X1 [Clarias gariepinus]|uniref:RWD domain-containing protein 3 isoform X1 n=1 Tax=Clarias gariepinus TaxID=13013 RepID=UPI00234DA362|nr:RWD domain-containing protein 3 isoform X1 [Clarias gariepinus]